MEKKMPRDLNDEMLLADALLRLKALENILVAKNVVTRDELSDEMDKIAKLIAKSLLEKANVPGDLDELIKSLTIKPDKGN